MPSCRSGSHIERGAKRATAQLGCEERPTGRGVSANVLGLFSNREQVVSLMIVQV